MDEPGSKSPQISPPTSSLCTQNSPPISPAHSEFSMDLILLSGSNSSSKLSPGKRHSKSRREHISDESSACRNETLDNNGHGPITSNTLSSGSPPTSPLAVEVSPPTSPLIFQSSPPTSPAHSESSMDCQSSSGSNSSSKLSPPKKLFKSRKEHVSRSTLERYLYHHSEGISHDPYPDVDIDLRNEAVPELGARIPPGHILVCSDVSDSYSESERSGSVHCSDSEEYFSYGDSGSENIDEQPLSEDRNSRNVYDSDSSAENSESESEGCVSSSATPDLLLFKNAHITMDKAILDVLKLYIKSRWTQTSLDMNIRLIKGLLPQPNHMPPSEVMVLNRVKEVSPFLEEVKHYYCSKCQDSWKDNSDTCSCGCTEKEFFFEYPLELQLKFLFENRNLANLIDQQKQRVHRQGVISDIQDGSEYQRVRSQLKGSYDLVLMLSSDGKSVSRSSKQEVWPILSIICDIPPESRNSYLLVCGVFVGKSKPRMELYMRPFVTSLSKLNDKGGLSWTDPRTKLSVKSRIECPVVCADAPAKAIILNVKHFSHRYGCNICEQKTKQIPLTAEELAVNENLPPRKKKRPCRRFVYEENDARLRSHHRMELQGELAELRKCSRKGVVGHCVLCTQPLFDRSTCLCAEYLHIVCLGVVKYFLNIMFSKKGPWYIGDCTGAIDEFVTNSIKVPDFIKRLPRGISDLAFLIGSELRAWLLYYSLSAFQRYLHPRYFQHWMLLVIAINALLQDSISESDLKLADNTLRIFVRDIKDLYGSKCYTYNVHCLLHLTTLVRRWGPLHLTSAFDFEKFNAFIARHVHGTKHIGQELLNTIKIIQSVKVFENFINAPKDQSVSGTAADGNVELCGKPMQVQLSAAECSALLEANILYYNVFSRVKIGSERYSSKHYDADKKRSNSFVHFGSVTHNNKAFGEILYFIQDTVKDSVYCLIKRFKLVHSRILFHLESRIQVRHVLPIEYSQEINCVPVFLLQSKIIKTGDYVCVRPNKYEVNL